MSDARISARNVLAAFLAAGLLALGSRLRLDLGETDHTLQTLLLVLIGHRLGPALGALSVVLYLSAGGLGAPVFRGGAGGIDVLLGSNGGYLWGFIPGVVAAGLAARKRAWGPLVWWFAVAHALVLLCGAAQMAIHGNLSPTGAFRLAIEPYWIGAAVKTVVAAYLARALAGQA